MDTAHLMPSSRLLRLVDVGMTLWVAAWIGLGVAIGINVDELSGLSRTVVKEGQAVHTVGGTLRTLSSVPLVGGEIGSTAVEVEQAGDSAVASGRSSASSVQALSILLAIAVALLPSVPVFAFYVPLRVRREREARALRRAVAEYGHDPEFQAFLGSRAIASLGYERLRRISETPWADVRDGNCEALAAAELRRLGIDPGLAGKGRAISE